jgi:signal transduction histidine kinase
MARRGTIVAVQLAMLLIVAAVAIESVAVARRSPGFSFVGMSGWAATLELAAGWSLVIAATACVTKPAHRTFAILLLTAAVSWFVVEWNNPGVGSAVEFTAGLVLYTVCPVLVSHAALRYTGRLDAAARAVVGVGYLSTVGLGGIGPAVAFDPGREGCGECPRNLVLIRDAPGVVERLTRGSTYAGIVWVVLIIGALGVRLARSSAAQRRLVTPVLVSSVGYLCLVGTEYIRSAGRGYFGDDAVDRRLWLAQGGLLIGIALATAWPFVRRRLVRSAVARLVVDVAAVPEAGRLSASLGAALGDRSLRVLYPVGDGRLADGSGRVAEPDSSRPRTRLTRDDATVALLEHRRGLLDEEGAAGEIVDAAWLALDNERLHAERRLQLEDLRASRARIVVAADTERRRLERDLHDGAQQKLVALALALQLARIRSTDPVTASRLDDARAEVAAALADLRTLARGLFPVELTDEGLAAALETLQESALVPFTVTSVVAQRLPAAVESAAYFAVVHCVVGPSSVSVTRTDGVLRVDIEGCGPPGDLVAVEDRVGALSGTVALEPMPGSGVRIRVVLPCAS